MQLDDLVASPEASQPEDSRLNPDERRREIASLLAVGVLRLLTRRGALAEAPSGDDGLDVSAAQRAHVHAG